MMNHTPCSAHTRSQYNAIGLVGFTVSSFMDSTYLIYNKHNRSEMVAVLGPFEALPYYIHTYIHT
jgi:hypothetical protein